MSKRAEIIGKWLAARGWSSKPELLAFKAGISARTLQRILAGDHDCIPESIWIRLHQATSIPLDDLIGADRHIPFKAISSPTGAHLEFSAIQPQNSTRYALTHHLRPGNAHITVRFNINPA